MKKLNPVGLLWLILFAAPLCFAASTLLDLAHQVKGVLAAANGGSGVSTYPYLETESTSKATAVTAAPAQNATKLYSFFISNTVSNVGNVEFNVTTADNSTNQYDLGVYGPGCNASGASIPLIWHTGANNGSSFAAAAVPGHLGLVGAPVTTAALDGWYCIAITGSAASPSMLLGGDANVSHVVQFTNGTAPGASTGTTSGGVLNSTITAPATGAGVANEPWLVFY